MQRPQLLGMPEHGGISDDPIAPPATAVEKTDSFFSNCEEPQEGHSASPSHSAERTRISDSLEHSRQLNSKIGINSIILQQVEKEIYHGIPGIKDSDPEKGSKCINYHFLGLLALEKLWLLLHRTDHDNGVYD